MEVQYVHVKTRSQFGKQCIFDDEGPAINAHILPNRDLMNDYVYRNPCHVGLQESKQFAVHEVQTSNTPTKESGMVHTEGGWPKEMNTKDDEAMARYRRRVEKDDNWAPKLKSLIEPMEHCVLQNNAVNIYENFFDDMVTTELVVPLDMRTVNVYEDPQTIVRPITHLSWSPDHGKRLAVSYCCMEFQRAPSDLNPWSYIWDIENPNKPFMILKASCPSVTIEFNTRDPSMLISGLMSGQVCNWDIRTGNEPVQISHLQFSHRNPTNLALWINSKSNTEFFSASTGGVIKWWDSRKLREPTETLVMDLENPMRGDAVRAIGVSALQFEPTMGTKFMAGMENGVVVSGTRKGKNPQEKLALRFACHYGPVVSIDRNPFSLKNFLTVGGWAAKIWAEDTREGCLVASKQHKIPLTGGCWSTSRYSVFYVIDGDGTLEVYDVLVGMKAPVKTIRLCENGLKAIAPHEEGTLVAVGSDRGKVYLVESSEALTTNSRNDKALLTAYLDRCSRYEKAVENRLKEIRLARRISYEQMEEPVQPTKGKGKGFAKDARTRDVINDKKAEDKALRTGGGGMDEKEKRSRIKMKKVKDTLVASDDAELADVELRYFKVVRKQMEEYAKIAALDENEEGVRGREAVSPAASSPSTMTEASTAAKRRKHQDSKGDKDGVGLRRSPEKRDDIQRRKGQRKSRSEKGGKPESGTEAIVIVRKSRSDSTTNQRHEDQRTTKKMDECTALERITEENGGEVSMITEVKGFKDATKKKMGKKKPQGEGEKHLKSMKHLKFQVKKPCADYVCEPDECCVDKTVHAESRIHYAKSKPSTVPETTESETDVDIEDMLTNLAKTALPGQFGSLLDLSDMTHEKSFIDDKDAAPRVLEEAVKVAKQETWEWRKLIKQRKSTSPIKLKHCDETKNVTIDENVDTDKTTRESESIDQVTASIERLSINDEPSIEPVNYVTRTKVKKRRDCEPIALHFTAKEITDVIGVPNAPVVPPSQSILSDSLHRVEKPMDYPRISAAAIPKLKITDYLSK